jgi:glycosyltransferase involved in cell wall biosynthesis
MELPSISAVIGAYNEASVLRETVGALVERFRCHPGSEIIIVENGSTDGTADVARALEDESARGPIPIRAAHTPKGLGNAVREGIRLARADRILITGADLPFGFSDLDAAFALDTRPVLVLGSKAHPDSSVEVGIGRRIMSSSYRMLQRRVLRVGFRDSQGSILIDRQIAQTLLPRLRSDGYFIETELVVRTVWLGYDPVEVPVCYLNPRTDSKVQPVRDSWDMLCAMFRLRSERPRKSLMPAPAPAPAPGPGPARPVSVS